MTKISMAFDGVMVGVVPGYLPRLDAENLEAFRTLAGITVPIAHRFFLSKVARYLRVHDIYPTHFARYPRGEKAPTRLFIATRREELRPWMHKFKETRRDKALLQKYKDVNPAICALLEGAEFGSLPDPDHMAVLPGEENLRDDGPPPISLLFHLSFGGILLQLREGGTQYLYGQQLYSVLLMKRYQGCGSGLAFPLPVANLGPETLAIIDLSQKTHEYIRNSLPHAINFDSNSHDDSDSARFFLIFAVLGTLTLLLCCAARRHTAPMSEPESIFCGKSHLQIRKRVLG
ncbi:hypothetical protein DL93DRAFT_2097271 [Clavulina sp. PMI_390]|nr:hypothetical protein DL93DRAFT_2097271 [Clavulina sp. PMI_390]